MKTIYAPHFEIPVKSTEDKAKRLRAILRANPNNKRMDSIRAKLAALTK